MFNLRRRRSSQNREREEKLSRLAFASGPRHPELRKSTNGNGKKTGQIVFDYKAYGILPGDIKVNDENHVDGVHVYYVFHCDPSGISFPLFHGKEKSVKCPHCGLAFWVPEGVEVHPSCPKRPKNR